MQQKQRSSVVISALLTTLVMALTAGGLLTYNGLLPQSDVSAQGATIQTVPEEAPVVVTAQPAPAQEIELAGQTARVQAESAELAAYQAQLNEAYTALQEAYTQIDILQTAQAQPAAAAYHEDDDDEHAEMPRGEHKSSSNLFGYSDHENDEREYDDD